ncbi:MAG: hypothetical protein IAF08_01115 [Rhizobacter sp.]|nr:hypothetical protein [Chlorobiales bacterium]
MLKATRFFNRVLGRLTGLWRTERRLERVEKLLGEIRSHQLMNVGSLHESEFSIFSQRGEDGILDFLTRHVKISKKTFVEFGVEEYSESNTRFLLLSRNWSGLVMDGNPEYVRFIKSDPVCENYPLQVVEAFITKENINELLGSSGVTGEIGVLSIDIDGNDYWIWEAVHIVDPAIVVVEYNPRFQSSRASVVPYKSDFTRFEAHYSGLYYGASLRAIVMLGKKKGYAFVGCSRGGANAFFVRENLRPDNIPVMTVESGAVQSGFKTARDASGKPLYVQPEAEERLLEELLRTLPVVDLPAE